MVDRDFRDYRKLKATPSTPEQTIACFKENPLDFKPGEKFRYSNSGYVVLLEILADLGHHPPAGDLRHVRAQELQNCFAGKDPQRHQGLDDPWNEQFHPTSPSMDRAVMITVSL